MDYLKDGIHRFKYWFDLVSGYSDRLLYNACVGCTADFLVIFEIVLIGFAVLKGRKQ